LYHSNFNQLLEIVYLMQQLKYMLRNGNATDVQKL